MNHAGSRRSRSRRWLEPTTLAVASLTAVGTYCVANWAWNKWYNDGTDKDSGEINEQQQNSREASRQKTDNETRQQHNNNDTRQNMNPHQWRSRRQRMVRCGDETIRALEGLLPSLRRTIEELTSTTKETQTLKELRNQQGNNSPRSSEAISLWETVKVRTITRLVATAYAHSILLLVVTVQCHLLGGKLFEEQIQTLSSEQVSTGSGLTSRESLPSDLMNSYGESHKMVLKHTYKYFFEHGIPELVKSVESTVSKVLQDWKFSDASCLSITRESFEDALNRIRYLEEQTTSSDSSRSRQPRSLLRFFIPPSGNLMDDEINDDLARWILDETWDLLESPVVSIAYMDCLIFTFTRMKDMYWWKIFDCDDTANTGRGATRPLAQVISKLKHTSRSFFEFQRAEPQGFRGSTYAIEIQSLPSVMELADVSFG